MSRRIAWVLCLVLGAAALPAASATASPAPKVVIGGTLRGDLGAATAPNPFVAARAALAANASRLGVDASAFRLERVRHSIIGIHVRGREYRGGVAVEGTSAAVDLIGGRVWQVQELASGLPGSPVARPLSGAAARALALHALGVTAPYRTPPVTRALVPVDGRLVDTWQVGIMALRPFVAATAVLDAATGRLLQTRDEARTMNGAAELFDPNPTVTLRDASLREPGFDMGGVDTDLDSQDLTDARRPMKILDVDGTELAAGRLLGPWVDVQGPLPLGISADFDFTRMDPRFEAVMAYAHLDRLQRYLQSLGFNGAAAVNAEPQNVIAFPVEGYDNSMYDPSNDSILYGAGGVDDAEDAEVILHEYGHAVQDAQVPGWGATHEGGSMGEAFGDFLAGSYYARTSGGFQDACVADWDSTSYSTGDPPCLRRLDTNKHYPQDKNSDVHLEGEIWSAFLWRIRDLLKCVPHEGCRKRSASFNANLQTRRVLTLVLASQELMTPQGQFKDGVAALQMAARALHQPRWVPLIVKAARERGLPLS